MSMGEFFSKLFVRGVAMLIVELGISLVFSLNKFQNNV